MTVVSHPAFRTAGYLVEAPFQELFTRVPQAWQRLFAHADRVPGAVPGTFMDVSFGATDGRYTELIGVEVAGDGQAPDGMVVREIPAASYIHFRHEGPAREIAGSFKRMLNWAEEKGLRPDGFKMDRGYTPSGDEESHDLYVRIAGNTAA